MANYSFADNCWKIATGDPKWQVDNLAGASAMIHNGLWRGQVNDHAARTPEEHVAALPMENASFNGHSERLAPGLAPFPHNCDQDSFAGRRQYAELDDTFSIVQKNGHHNPYLFDSHDASKWDSMSSARIHTGDFPKSSRGDSVNHFTLMESLYSAPSTTSNPDSLLLFPGGSASRQSTVPTSTPCLDEPTTRRAVPDRRFGSYTSEPLVQDPPLTDTPYRIDPNYAASVHQPNAIGGVLMDATQDVDPWNNFFLLYTADANPMDPYDELASSYAEGGTPSTCTPSSTGAEPHLKSLTLYDSFEGLPIDSILPIADSGAALQPAERQSECRIQPTVTEDMDTSYESDEHYSSALDFTVQPAALHPELCFAGSSTTPSHRLDRSSFHTTHLGSLKSTPETTFEIVRYEGEDVGTKRRKLGVQIANQEPTKKRILYGNTGKVLGSMHTLGRQNNVRARFDKKSRLETALQRKVGNCERCRARKRKCDIAVKSLYESCTACICIRLYKNIPKMPCFRSDLRDATFFRLGPSYLSPYFTKRNQDFDLSEFVDPGGQVSTVELTHHLGHNLAVYVSRFVPENADESGGDRILHTWTNSVGTHYLEMPSYCLVNLEQIRANMRQYMQHTRGRTLRLRTGTCELTWYTIQRAINFAASRRDSMVGRALDLWAACRILEKSWKICGDETLGITRFVNRTKRIPWRGASLANPIMKAQLDHIMVQDILNPLRMNILQELSRKIEANEPEFWFEIYLTIFTLLSSIEVSSAHDHYLTKRCGRPNRFADMRVVEGWFHTCKILLSRFHYVCGGSAPLRADWKKPATAKFARLKADEAVFMAETKEKIIRNGTNIPWRSSCSIAHLENHRTENISTMLRLEHQYERKLYWCHQLFLENWDTGTPHIMPEKPWRTFEQLRATIVLQRDQPTVSPGARRRLY